MNFALIKQFAPPWRELLEQCRDLPEALALGSTVERGDFSVQFIICRQASVSRVDARGFADAFCEAFPICARRQLPNIGERIDAGVVENAPNIGGRNGLS